MEVREHAATFNLSDQRVAVCGDWRGNRAWIRMLAPAIQRLASDISTILQLGDWWMDLEASDEIFAAAGIKRVLVTLGNHEPWPAVVAAQESEPGDAVRVSASTWLLPRPFRFTVGGRRILSLGGAASVGRAWRRPGRDWWPHEAISDDHVSAAIAGGSADIMLTHESPARTPVRAVQDVLRTNPMGFPVAALAESAESRERVAHVWDAVHPTLLLHGHMHVAGGGVTDDERRVSSLGQDERQGNVLFLDLATLRADAPSLRQIQEASRGR